MPGPGLEGRALSSGLGGSGEEACSPQGPLRGLALLPSQEPGPE